MVAISVIVTLVNIAVFLAAFIGGFILVYRNLAKVNLIESEKFDNEDWGACVAFGGMFGLALLFVTNLLLDTGIDEEIPNVAGFVILALLAILVIYPLWEVIVLGRPTSDSVHDLHKFLETKILDRFQGNIAYFISFLIFVVIYLVPIALISLIGGLPALQVAMMWFIVFPLFFLNYFSASGQIAGILRATYIHTVPTNIMLEQKEGNAAQIDKIKHLVFILIAWAPFLLAFYNIANGIMEATAVAEVVVDVAEPDNIDPLVILNMLVTILFGIKGFFQRFWNKKSKTKVIDFVFSGYIFIAIAINMLLSFLSLSPSTVNGILGLTIGGAALLEPLKLLLANPTVLLPINLVQSLVVAVYGTKLLLSKKSEFQADVRLSAVTKAYGIVSVDQLASQDAEMDKKKKKKEPKYDLPTLFKSVLLAPVYNAEGSDTNIPVREKAAKYLLLICRDNPKFAQIIIDIIAQNTIEPEKLPEGIEKSIFISKDAVDFLGFVGTIYPDKIADRLIQSISKSDYQLQNDILDALGDIGESKENVGKILDQIKDLFVDPKYEIRTSAYNSLIEMVTEGDYQNPEFLEIALGPVYEILEKQYANAEAVESALEAILRMCVKIAKKIKFDKILPFLDYSEEGKDKATVGFVHQNAIGIIAATVYYNLDAFPTDKMMAFMDDEREYVRYVAIDAVGNYILKRKDAKIEEILVKMMKKSLEEEDDDVVEMCQESIAEFLVINKRYEVTIDGKNVQILNYYTDALNSPTARIAENASEAMKVIAPIFQDDIWPILEANIKGNNEEVARDCMHTLGLLDEHIHKQVDLELLYNMSKKDDPTTRAEAIFALGMISDNRDIDEKVLVERLDDDDPTVRLEAIFALGKIGVNKPDDVISILIQRFFDLDRAADENVSETELYAESLGVIGESHPNNEVIIALQQALMGDTNPYAKDVVAKALGAIGNGMIGSGNAKRIIESEAFYNNITWLSAAEKSEYTLGNLIIIFIEALQQKGIPEESMDIISDSIQDLLPAFAFVENEEKPGHILKTIKFLLAQAYYSNYNSEILETIDRIDSILAFKQYFTETDPALKEQFEFYSKQYTSDGKQFHDQGEAFTLMAKDNAVFLDYALKSFEIAVDLTPNEYFTPNCHFQIAEIFKKQGRNDEAKAKYEEALEIFATMDEIEMMKECEDAISSMQ